LFEVVAARPNDAAEALQRLEQLGRYEYRITPTDTWLYCQPKRAEEILAELPVVANVYANVYAQRTR
jgi:hypothetical protein